MGNTVIPRFSFPQLDQSSDPLEIGMEPSANGEYVLWQDVRHLFEEGVSDVRLTLEFILTSEKLPEEDEGLLFLREDFDNEIMDGCFVDGKFFCAIDLSNIDPIKVLAWAKRPWFLSDEQIKSLVENRGILVTRQAGEPLPQFDPNPTKPAA